MTIIIKSRQLLEALFDIDVPATLGEIVRLMSITHPNERMIDLTRKVKRALDVGVRCGYIYNDDKFYYPTENAEDKIKELESDCKTTIVPNATEPDSVDDMKYNHSTSNVPAVEEELFGTASTSSSTDTNTEVGPRKSNFAKAVQAYYDEMAAEKVASRSSKGTDTKDISHDDDDDEDDTASLEDGELAPTRRPKRRAASRPRRPTSRSRSRASSRSKRSASRQSRPVGRPRTSRSSSTRRLPSRRRR